MKRGSRGAVAAGPGGETVEVEARRVAAVDTTGAGDAFDAGLIAALRDGATFAEAVAFAVRLASAVVARPSADRYPGPDALG